MCSCLFKHNTYALHEWSHFLVYFLFRSLINNFLFYYFIMYKKCFIFQSCTLFFLIKYEKLELDPLSVLLPSWFVLIFPDTQFYAPILASLHDPIRRRRYSQPSPFSPQKDIQYFLPSQIKQSSKSTSSSHDDTQYRCTHCDFRCTWKYDLKMHLKKKHGIIVKN